MPIPYSFFQENGFDVTINTEGQYNLISVATGATILRCGTLKELNEFVRGINYAVTQDVEKWKRPIRETGWHIVRG